jgi:hypothetical protein
LAVAERLRGWFARTSTRAAIALVVVGCLFLLLEAQSPSKVYWTGVPVPGVDHGGIIYYSVHGQQETIDAPGPAPRHDTPVTVYVDRTDPTHALVSGPGRWIEGAFLMGWFLVAAVLLLSPPLRRLTRREPSRVEDRGDWIHRYYERQHGSG